MHPDQVPSAKRVADHVAYLKGEAPLPTSLPYGSTQATGASNARAASSSSLGLKKPPPGYTCNHCKSKDQHYFRDCPHMNRVKMARGDPAGAGLGAPHGYQQQPGEDRGYRAQAGSLPSGYICHRCQQPGHLVRFCPERNRDPRGEDNGQGDEHGHPAGTADDSRTSLGAHKGAPISCWFCLDNPQTKWHLIVDEQMGPFYLARPIGAIDDLHLLLVPREHITQLLQSPPSPCEEEDHWRRALKATMTMKWIPRPAVCADLCVQEQRILRELCSPDAGMLVVRINREAKHHWHEQLFPVPKRKSNEQEESGDADAGADANTEGASFVEYLEKYLVSRQIYLAPSSLGNIELLFFDPKAPTPPPPR